MTDIKEELTKMLMESYDKGVADTKKAAEEAIVKAVDFATQQEREACANVADVALLGAERHLRERVVRAIRARGEK